MKPKIEEDQKLVKAPEVEVEQPKPTPPVEKIVEIQTTKEEETNEEEMQIATSKTELEAEEATEAVEENEVDKTQDENAEPVNEAEDLRMLISTPHSEGIFLNILKTHSL